MANKEVKPLGESIWLTKAINNDLTHTFNANKDTI